MAVAAVAGDIGDIANSFTVGAAIVAVVSRRTRTSGVGAFLESYHAGTSAVSGPRPGVSILLEFGVGRVAVFRQVTTVEDDG